MKTDQDPAVWVDKGHPEVTKAALNSLRLRYQLLPYLYTLFYHAHVNGHTVARPLFHEFPLDNNTHAIDEQFMLGPSLLISPFLYDKQTVVKAYLPNCLWYDLLFNMTKVNKTGKVKFYYVSPKLISQNFISSKFNSSKVFKTYRVVYNFVEPLPTLSQI